MISIINTAAILFFLFYILGKSADKIVHNVRIISEKMGIPIVFLGAILGFFTSLPETAIGINAIINNIQAVALGNLLGGIIVILCLVLGINLILNRKIKTDGKITHIVPIFVFILTPLVLGMDNKLGFVDGLILIISYVGIIFFLYKKNVSFSLINISSSRSSKITREIMYLIISVSVVIIASNLIIRETSLLLQQTNLSPFVVGMLFFSIGTNLPEMAVMIRSWKLGSSELSVSHLLGSVMANVLIIGLFSIYKTMPLTINFSFYFLAIYLVLISVVILYFYKSEKKLTRREGFVLIGSYFVFVIAQILYF